MSSDIVEGMKWRAVTAMGRAKDWDGDTFGTNLTRSELATLYDTALAAIQETHAVVPREASYTMLKAGDAEMRDPTGLKQAWAAMIAASDAP